jgi:hypothetical protein
MWKLDLKEKCIHQYKYDSICIHIYEERAKEREREIENMMVIVGWCKVLEGSKTGRE